MNFKQAQQKLKKIAKDRYYSLSYEITDSQSKLPIKQICRLYIDGLSFYESDTWAKAFDKLKSAMTTNQKVKIDAIDAIDEL